MNKIIIFLLGYMYASTALAQQKFLLVSRVDVNSEDGKSNIRSQILFEYLGKSYPITITSKEWKTILYCENDRSGVFFLEESESHLNFGYAFSENGDLKVRRMENFDLQALFKVFTTKKQNWRDALLGFKNIDGKTLLESSLSTYRIEPSAKQ